MPLTNAIFSRYCLVFYPEASTCNPPEEPKLSKSVFVLLKEKRQIRRSANHFGSTLNNQ